MVTFIPMTLGQLIRQARDAARLSQQDVANHLGVTRNAVSLWESDENLPKGRTINKLSRYLKIPLPELWKTMGVEAEVEEDSEQRFIDSPATVRHASVILPELDVRAGMGGGSVVESETQIAEWSIPQNVLSAQTTGPMSALKIIQALGSSNEPDIPSGTRLIIDTSDKRPSPPGYFALWDGLGLVIKRVEYLLNSDPPTIRIASANPAFAVYELTLEEVSIAGRVMGRWAWM